MKVLEPLKVTNDWLDEVSNYYRYRPEKGELWPTTPAKAYAVVEDGTITKSSSLSPAPVQLAAQSHGERLRESAARVAARVRNRPEEKRRHRFN